LTKRNIQTKYLCLSQSAP